MSEYFRLLRDDIRLYAKGDVGVERDDLLRYLDALDKAIDAGQIGGGGSDLAIYFKNDSSPKTPAATSLRFTGSAVSSITTSGNDVTIDLTGGTGGGDMSKSTYDIDEDGVVDSSEKVIIPVKNDTAGTLTKGTIVYIKEGGSSTDTPSILKASATDEATSSKTIGAVFASIPSGGTGYIVTIGQLHGDGGAPLDTSMYTIGTKLWLSTTAGEVTSTRPSWPNHSVFIGHVTRSQGTNGRILYSIMNGHEVDELHDVYLNSIANSDILVYNSTTTPPRWENKSVSTWLGYTPATAQSITAATKTKITYNSQGVITSGADATTADIADSSDKRYVTDDQQTALGTIVGSSTNGYVLKTNGSGTVSWSADTDTTYALSSTSVSSGGTVTLTPSTGSATVVNVLGSGSTSVASSSGNTLTISSTDTNYYPTTWTWTDGTSAGPTASIAVSGTSAVSVAAIPAASSTISGVVTTAAQTFAGIKTFSSSPVVPGLSASSASGTFGVISNITTGTLNLGIGITTGVVNIGTAGVSGAGAINIGRTGTTTTISGDLIVNGTQTTVNSNTVALADKNLELAKITAKTGLVATLVAGSTTVTLTTGNTSGMIPGQVLTKTAGTGAFGAGALVASITSATVFEATVAHATSSTTPAATFTAEGSTNDTANGAGIIVIGPSGSDKTILWNKATPSWDISDNIAIPSGKSYYIGSTAVLSSNSVLGYSIGANTASSIVTTDATQTLTNKKVGSASQVVITDASGFITTQGALSNSRGGTGYSTYVKGDILYSDATDSLSKLSIGTTAGHVLTVSSTGIPEWKANPSGFSDPMNTAGDLIYKNSANVTTRLPIGSSNQVLTVTGAGTISWATPASGFADPMSAAGDLIYRNPSNTTTRLAAGSVSQVLTVTSAGTLGWSTPTTGFSDPMSAAGDLIYRNPSNTTARLAAGSVNQILTVTSAGTLGWSSLDADLTAIAGLSGTGFLKRTGTDTWALDTDVLNSASTLDATKLTGSIAFARLPNLYIGGTAVQSSSANQELTKITKVTFPNSGNVATSTVLQQSSGSIDLTLLLPSAATSGLTLTLATTTDIKDSTITVSSAGGIYAGTTTNPTGTSGSFTLNQSTNSTIYLSTNATNANTASAIVSRDASGNFSAGTITASLTGNATTATTATNATNVAITDDNSLSSDVYPVWSSATSGNIGLKTSSTSALKFNPSTGLLSVKDLKLTNSSFATAGFLKNDASGNVSTGSIAYSNLPSIANATILGNNSGAGSAPSALNVATVTSMLNLFNTATTDKGLVPGSFGVGGSYYLNANGGWSIPPGGSFSDPTNTAGDLIYRDSSNTIARLPIGSTNQVLTVTGANTVAWATPTGGGGGSSLSSNTAFTAGTNAQGQGVLSSNTIHIVTATSQTTTSAFSGVTLPTPTAGSQVVVVNNLFTDNLPARTLRVYPASGHTIGNLSANTPIPLSPGQSVSFYGVSGTAWTSSSIEKNDNRSVPHHYVPPQSGIWLMGGGVHGTSSGTNTAAFAAASVITRNGAFVTFPRRLSISQISFGQISCAATTYTLACGLYEINEDGLDGNLVANSGKLGIPSAGLTNSVSILTFSPTITVFPDRLYLMAFMTNSKPTTGTTNGPVFATRAHVDALYGWAAPTGVSYPNNWGAGLRETATQSPVTSTGYSTVPTTVSGISSTFMKAQSSFPLNVCFKTT